MDPMVSVGECHRHVSDDSHATAAPCEEKNGGSPDEAQIPCKRRPY
jgi:hypothetical protein